MCLASIQEYPLTEEKDRSRSRERPNQTRRPPPRRSSGRSQPGRLPASRANWSTAGDETEDAYWEDELDTNDDGGDTHDDVAYLCNSCGPDKNISDVVDQAKAGHRVHVSCSRWFLERRRCVRGRLGMRPRGVRRVLRTGRSNNTSWSDSGKGCSTLQARRSEGDENRMHKRRKTQRAEPVIARTTGAMIKCAHSLLAIACCRAARRNHEVQIGAGTRRNWTKSRNTAEARRERTRPSKSATKTRLSERERRSVAELEWHGPLQIELTRVVTIVLSMFLLMPCGRARYLRDGRPENMELVPGRSKTLGPPST